jgi:hypothetical protein
VVDLAPEQWHQVPDPLITRLAQRRTRSLTAHDPE